VDPFDLVPAEGKLVLDIVGCLGIVGQLAGAVLVPAQLPGGQPDRVVPGQPPFPPPLEPLLVGAGPDEELHLHLLELAGPEDEVARRDLVPERLADLGDAERDPLARSVEHVLVVDVDPLRRFRAEVDHRSLLLHRAHEGLEHQVEHPGLGQLAGGMLTRMLAGLLGALGVLQLVGPESRLAGLTVHQRIGEPGHVPRRLPDARVHQDRGVQPLDVVPGVHHRPPPPVLDVLLELDSQRAVVPYRAEPAVDLGGLEHEAAPLAQRHELVHQDGIGHDARGLGKDR
jgi:hypothetical protein